MKKLEPVHIKFLRWLNRKVDGFAARGGCAEAKRAQHPYGAPCSRATQATSNKEDGQLPIQPEGKRHILCAQTLIQIILIIIGVFFVTAAFLFFQIYNASKLDMAAKADAIVVLGAAQYNGKPSPVLEARLNHAYELYKKDLAPLIITTGGIYSGALPTGRQEKCSEGEVG
ncbi:YdcF family protein [Candidatus Peregrinibacteria bacterium]|nr:YdcF family protein [Candidatus Peregrinibacteria bacterium]